MTHSTLHSGEYFLIDVREDAHNFSIRNGNLKSTYLAWHTTKWCEREYLPRNNNYELIGKGNELTKEQWSGIVEYGSYPFLGRIIKIYKDYSGNDDWFFSPRDSGYSWLSSLNLEPEKIFILKKI